MKSAFYFEYPYILEYENKLFSVDYIKKYNIGCIQIISNLYPFIEFEFLVKFTRSGILKSRYLIIGNGNNRNKHKLRIVDHDVKGTVIGFDFSKVQYSPVSKEGIDYNYVKFRNDSIVVKHKIENHHILNTILEYYAISEQNINSNLINYYKIEELVYYYTEEGLLSSIHRSDNPNIRIEYSYGKHR